MEKSTRKVVLLFVGLAVIGLAGSAAAASLAAPGVTTTTAFGNALLGAQSGASPGVHVDSPAPPPAHHGGGCPHSWWG